MESTASSGLDLFGQVCDYAAILDPFGVAKAAVGIARMIQVIAQKCKANKARCQLLGERAKVAEQLMGNLMSLNLTSELVPRLKEFGECLFEAEKLVGNFHGTRGLKRVLKVGAFEKGFEIVGKRLDFCFQSMNLAVGLLLFHFVLFSHFVCLLLLVCCCNCQFVVFDFVFFFCSVFVDSFLGALNTHSYPYPERNDVPTRTTNHHRKSKTEIRKPEKSGRRKENYRSKRRHRSQRPPQRPHGAHEGEHRNHESN